MDKLPAYVKNGKTVYFPSTDDLFSKMFTYSPMTGEELEISNINDTIEWAEAISGEWNGDESGSQEDRAHCANEIIEKLNEVKELILGMGEL
jgi:hypothetical protein